MNCSECVLVPEECRETMKWWCEQFCAELSLARPPKCPDGEHIFGYSANNATFGTLVTSDNAPSFHKLGELPNDIRFAFCPQCGKKLPSSKQIDAEVGEVIEVGYRRARSYRGKLTPADWNILALTKDPVLLARTAQEMSHPPEHPGPCKCQFCQNLD